MPVPYAAERFSRHRDWRNDGKGIMRRIAALLLFSLLLAAPTPAVGQREADSPRGPRYLNDIAETPGLDLTAGQQRKIAELKDLHWKEILVLRKELKERGRELKELWLAQSPDQSKIQAVQAEVQAIQGRLRQRLKAYNEAVYEILRPEQREKIKDLPWTRGGAGHLGPGGPRGMHRKAPWMKGWPPERPN